MTNETTTTSKTAATAVENATVASEKATAKKDATKKKATPKAKKAAPKAKDAAKPTAKAKSAKAKKAAKPAKKDGTFRPGTKGAKILELVSRSKGASLAELMKAAGWQAHSVRGFISGTLGTKMGLNVNSAKREDGERVYTLSK